MNEGLAKAVLIRGLQYANKRYPAELRVGLAAFGRVLQALHDSKLDEGAKLFEGLSQMTQEEMAADIEDFARGN